MSDNTSEGMGAGSYIIADDVETKKAVPVAPKKVESSGKPSAPAGAVVPGQLPQTGIAGASNPVPGVVPTLEVKVPEIVQQTKEAQKEMGPAKAAPMSNILEDENFQKGALSGAALLAALGLTGLAAAKVMGKEGKAPAAPSGTEPVMGGEPTQAKAKPQTLSESVAQQKAAAAPAAPAPAAAHAAAPAAAPAPKPTQAENWWHKNVSGAMTLDEAVHLQNKLARPGEAIPKPVTMHEAASLMQELILRKQINPNSVPTKSMAVIDERMPVGPGSRSVGPVIPRGAGMPAGGGMPVQTPGQAVGGRGLNLNPDPLAQLYR